jgi:competence protein ComEA
MRHGSRLRAGLLPAAACIISAGLLWSALSDREGSIPEGWTPVNDRVEAALADLEAGQESGENRGKNGEEEQADRLGAKAAGAMGAAGAGGVGKEHEAAAEAIVAESAGVAEAGGDAGGADRAEGEEGVEGADSGDDAGVAGKLDLNAATASELDALPGIGPAKAQAILADRQSNGPYASVEELTRVKGIGAKLLEKLRPHIRAGR